MNTFRQNLKSPSRIIIFLSIVFAFFLIDWLTKHYLFLNNEASGDYGVLGVRSFPHDNSTIFSSLKVDLHLWIRITLNFVILIAFTSPIFFTRSIFLAIGLGILVAGILGNGLDIIPAREIKDSLGNPVSHYVRDVFYTPWADKGTFNSADVFIVFGAGLVVIRTFIQLFKKEK